ncbi:hypothetical protein EfmAA94_05160 [Enterococcus faecium]|nr:hypothetical protein EfmAA94_05160 [Enterococcus faecium]
MRNKSVMNAEFMRAAINAKRDENDKISVMALILVRKVIALHSQLV